MHFNTTVPSDPGLTQRKMMQDDFPALVAEVTRFVSGRRLDAALATHLNATHGPGSPVYEALFTACRDGVADGWMCQREAGGIRYGRIVKPGPATHGFSVDVVDMADVAGPHHTHPAGEIDLVMPLAAGDALAPGGGATFDGQAAGWKVYPPGSSHCPTVGGGRALVLYLLPGGAIEFTR
jgi:hypothetical protein